MVGMSLLLQIHHEVVPVIFYRKLFKIQRENLKIPMQSAFLPFSLITETTFFMLVRHTNISEALLNTSINMP